MTRFSWFTATIAVALSIGGCDIDVDVEGDEEGEEEGGEEEGGEEEGGEEEGGEEEGGESSSGGEEEGGEEEEGGGESSSGGGTNEECDLFAQDCPADEKCVGWSNDGGPIHNATRCAPIDSQPGQAGDQCIVEGSETSGIDTCDIMLQCLYTDPETNIGHCVPLCLGSAEEPVCVDPSTSCQFYNGMVLTACLED